MVPFLFHSLLYVNIDFLIHRNAPSLATFLKSQISQPHFLLVDFLMSGPVLYPTAAARLVGENGCGSVTGDVHL